MKYCNYCDVTSVYSLNSRKLPGRFSYGLGTRLGQSVEWYGNVTRERSGCGVAWERGQAVEWYGNVTREGSGCGVAWERGQAVEWYGNETSKALLTSHSQGWC